MRPLLNPLLVLWLGLTSCTDCGETPQVVRVPRPVEIDVEVFDPVTGGVWENVGVRIVQADQEWSDCTCVSPHPDEFALTDATGIAYFSPYAIAAYEVGFALDAAGRAVIGPDAYDDESYVLIEAWAPGFDPVYAEVRLTWDRPYRFVSIPF